MQSAAVVVQRVRRCDYFKSPLTLHASAVIALHTVSKRACGNEQQMGEYLYASDVIHSVVVELM